MEPLLRQREGGAKAEEGLPGSSGGKKSACNMGDLGSIPRLGRFPWRRAWRPTPVCLPGEPRWTEEPGGLWSTGSHRVGHDWVTKYTHSWAGTEDCGPVVRTSPSHTGRVGFISSQGAAFPSDSESHSVMSDSTPWTIQSTEFSRPEYWGG